MKAKTLVPGARLLVVVLGLVASAVPAAAAEGGLPLVFESAAVGGRAPDRFVARGPGFEIAIGAAGARIALVAGDASGGAVVGSTLVGADPSASLLGEQPLPGGTSHFLGSDPSKWRRAVPTFHRLRSRGVYPGVDMVWHGRGGTLEYDFVVAPGADPSSIVLAFDSAGPLRIDAGGDLVLEAGGKLLRWKKPVSFQEVDGRRVEVSSRFRSLGEGRVGFELGAWDRSLPVVIDPVLSYSTYIASPTFVTGDGLQNHGLAITTDKTGHAYITGVTQTSGYPVTAGAFDETRPGDSDMFVAKLSPAGDELEWATFLGGTAMECDNNRSADIAVDAAGYVYVTGVTKSADFPTTPGAFDTALSGNSDAFVTKLSPDGSSLEWSTYLGGNAQDRGWGIAVDAVGHVFVGGETNDVFPTTPGAYQTDSDNQAAFATKFEADGASLVWSTTIGRATGAARDLAIDKDGNVYLTGLASAGNGVTTGYPVTPGAFQTTVEGSFDSFVTKMKNDGSALVWSTFLGGSANEDGHAIGVDGTGNVYVLGSTNSTDLPATSAAFQKTLQSPSIDDAFVAKLDASGASLSYCTYLGGSSLEDPLDLVVDGGGNALVVGATFSSDFPTTADAIQKDFNPGPVSISAWVAKVSGTGGLSYSTLNHPVLETAGGSSFAYGIALDGTGAAFMTGTGGYGMPTTLGAFQEQPATFGAAGPIVTKYGSIATPSTKPVVCGDFTGDGKITASDALGVLKAAVGSGTCGLAVCDFTGDGKVSAADALATLKTAVGQPVTAKCPVA